MSEQLLLLSGKRDFNKKDIPHFHHEVRGFLVQKVLGKWIGWDGSIILFTFPHSLEVHAAYVFPLATTFPKIAC